MLSQITKKSKLFSSYSKMEKKSFVFCYLFIAFPVLQFCVFWVGINASSIFYSFTDGAGRLTLTNYKNVFLAFTGKDPYGFNVGASLLRSFVAWCISTFLNFPIGLLTTYVLYKRIPGHYALRICYIIPGLMGTIVWTSLVSFMLAYDGGITILLQKIGVNLPSEVWKNGLLSSGKTAFPSLLIVGFVMGIVGNNAVLTGAYSRIPTEIYESAEMDGAKFFTTFFKIAVPCIWSTISTLLVFQLCSIFTADVNVFLYSKGTGEPNMSTIGFLLYNMTYQISLTGGTSSSYGYPSALGMVLTLFTLPIVLIGRRALDKIQEAVEL